MFDQTFALFKIVLAISGDALGFQGALAVERDDLMLARALTRHEIAN